MMLRSFRDWLDSRTGHRRLIELWRSRTLPGGPRWRYVTGSCLLWTLVVEIVTGLLLMISYSPSTTSAWASVHYIDHMAAGQFIRGLHYFAGQALIILFALHTVRVLLDAAFRAPHELIWATGLLLIPVVLLWAISGNPLAWTQRGYGQIEVETNIIGSTPLVGPVLKRVLVGGDELGNLTITHLYFLHVALFPLLAAALLVVHITQIYRHGPAALAHSQSEEPSTPYWPYQSFRNLAVFGVILATISWLALRYGHPLDAPADPVLAHTPRPEWYFLFLFELRRHFSGQWEFVATTVIPLASLVVLLAMPMIDRMLPGRLGAAVRFLLLGIGVTAWTGLTLAAAARDWRDPHFQASAKKSAALGARARTLADAEGIPPIGAVALLRNDPKTQGPLLFRDHCATCHRWNGHDGTGKAPLETGDGAQQPAAASASDLAGFGTPEWIRRMLTEPNHDDFFGRTQFKDGEMVRWAAENVAKMTEEEIHAVAQLLASQAQREDLAPPAPEVVEMGIDVFSFGGAAETQACASCHTLEHPDILPGDALVPAPNLTGYGSEEWLKGMISDPGHPDFYGENNDRMPAFAERLREEQVQLLVDWMRREWYEPVGHSPAGPDDD